MKARQHGFTLIELMFTILALGVLLGVGVPNFVDLMRNSRMVSATNDILSDFNLARSEAVKRRVPVTLCKSQNGTACDGDATDPFLSWIVFVDDADPAAASANDGNGVVNTGEEILRRREIHDSLTVTVNGWQLRYLPNGFPLSITTSDAVSQMVICDSQGNKIGVGGVSAARGITVAATGRPSSTRDIALITTLGGCP
jgi:type IV fimbrial biogenesis protein FimT